MKCWFLALFLVFGLRPVFAQYDEEFRGINARDPEVEERYKEFLSESYKRFRYAIREEYRREIRQFYQTRYESSLHRLTYGHFLLNKDLDDYLLVLKSLIADANPDFNFSEVEIIVTRYNWPNAFSIGDGTLALNIGLLTRLENEAQLAFIICHEASHYFLNHADIEFIRRYWAVNSAEYRAKIEEINTSEYYTTTRIKSLIRSNIYSELNHSRFLESQADSLGLEMYLNAGFDKDDAMRTLELLDGLNEPEEVDLNLFELFAIDTVRFPPSELYVEDAHKDDVLHDDSIKTHPDCSERIRVIRATVNNRTPTMPSMTAEFSAFQQMLVREHVHSMFYFNDVDQALIVSLKRRMEDQHSGMNNSAIIISLERLLEARENHRIGLIVSKPGKHQCRAANELSHIAFALRFKTMSTSFYAYAKELYPEALRDQKTILAMMNMARLAGSEEDFKEYQETFLRLFRDSRLYRTVKDMTFN